MLSVFAVTHDHMLHNDTVANNDASKCAGFAIFSKIFLQKHGSLAQDMFTYMSIIRDALSDAPFDIVYQYDRQFR